MFNGLNLFLYFFPNYFIVALYFIDGFASIRNIIFSSLPLGFDFLRKSGFFIWFSMANLLFPAALRSNGSCYQIKL
jgi:hypothetical protein